MYIERILTMHRQSKIEQKVDVLIKKLNTTFVDIQIT